MDVEDLDERNRTVVLRGVTTYALSYYERRNPYVLVPVCAALDERLAYVRDHALEQNGVQKRRPSNVTARPP